MTDLPPKAERRPTGRRRVLLPGILVHSEGLHSFKCTMRNISDTGARVTVPKGDILPTSVCLIDVKGQKGHEATLMWIRGGEAGLAFRESFDMNTVGGTRFAYLKPFWTMRD
jgi:hypothetical protein